MKQFIFWCQTNGHEEDWFIQAPSLKSAKDSHAYFEGFNLGTTKARMICEIPKEMNKSECDWPSHEQLKQLGFEFIQEEEPRIVRYNGKIYKEGGLIDVFFNNQLLKKPSVYLMQIRRQDHYKIGYSKDVNRRKRELSINSPYHLDIVNLITTPNARLLEYEIFQHFKKYSVSKEWLTLDKWLGTTIYYVFDLYTIEFDTNFTKSNDSFDFNNLLKILTDLIQEHTYEDSPSSSEIVRFQIVLDEIVKVRTSKYY